MWIGAIVELLTKNFFIKPTIIIEFCQGTESCQSKTLVSFSVSYNLIRWPRDDVLTSGNAVDVRKGSSSVLIATYALKGGNGDIVDILR